MPLLNPSLFAVALAAVAVPVLVHFLLRRRRKPIAFGAMRFVLEAYKNQRKRSKFEQLFLLLARCLVLIALAFAVGRPLARSGIFTPTAGGSTLILVIDNGLTSSVTTGKPELEVLKESAEKLVRQLSTSRGDKVAIITAAAPIDAPIAEPAADFAGVLDTLKRIESADSASDLPAAMVRARDLVGMLPGENREGVTIAVLSSWRAGSADLSKPGVPLALPESVRVIATSPMEITVPNVTLVSAEPARLTVVLPDDARAADKATSLVRLTATRTDSAVARSVTVKVAAVAQGGGQTPAGSGVIAFASGAGTASAVIPVEIPAEVARSGQNLALVATIDSADAITRDNTAMAVIASRIQLRVGLLTSARLAGVDTTPERFTPAEWLALALSPEATALDRKLMEVEAVTLDPANVPPAELARLDAAFISSPELLSETSIRELAAMIRAGKLVVVFPPKDPATPAWADRLIAGLGLPLTVARAPQTLPSPVPLTLAVAAGSQKSLLDPIAAELPGLIRPITVSRLWPIDTIPREWARVLDASGQPVCLAGRAAGSSGLILWWAITPDLAWTNLPAMPLFVPLVQEVLRQGIGSVTSAAVAPVGGLGPWPAQAAQLRSIDRPGAAPTRPQSPGEPARYAGLWRALDQSGRTLGLFGTLHDATAGRTEPADRSRVRNWLSGFTGSDRLAWIDDAQNTAATMQTNRDQTPWDLWLLAAVAFFLVVEAAAARRVSPVSSGAQTPGLSGQRQEAAA